jgi:hypothetical protein
MKGYLQKYKATGPKKRGKKALRELITKPRI